MTRKTPEGRFKEELIKDLKDLFPGCVILWNDAQMLTGVPDMLLLWNQHWAMLEAKESARAKKRPNQDYYINLFGEMSFAAFIFPENKEEVLHALQQAFRPRRQARIPQR